MRTTLKVYHHFFSSQMRKIGLCYSRPLKQCTILIFGRQNKLEKLLVASWLSIIKKNPKNQSECACKSCQGRLGQKSIGWTQPFILDESTERHEFFFIFFYRVNEVLLTIQLRLVKQGGIFMMEKEIFKRFSNGLPNANH